MRVLLINPNTMTAMTDLVMRVVAPNWPAGIEIRAATGRFGPRYIASRSAAAIAGHAALDAYAEHGAGCDAVYLACFGDPGLAALREVATVPVIGMADASCHAAAKLAGRFAIVTGGERWGAMLHEFVGTLGLGEALAAIETVAPNGAEIAADPEGAARLLAEACERTVRRDGAKAVILGGAGLAGLAARIQPLVSVPVLCSAEAGAKAVLAALAAEKPAPSPLPAPVESIGLAPALASLLARG